MRVTRFQYPLEDSLIKKLDVICNRINGNGKKKDAELIIEGKEGEGKTTMSIAIAYYIAEKTGRDFSHKDVYFDVSDMIPIAQKTSGKIFIWDEPALQALSTDWAKKQVVDLKRLIMMARKRRHLFMINMTKFSQFGEYFVVDRAVAMVRVYSRNEMDTQQRFVWIPGKKLEALWRDYRFSKKRNYKKYASRKCRGVFPDILNPDYKYNVLKEFNVDAYEKMKDKAIESIGKNDKVSMKPIEEKLIRTQYAITKMPGTQEEKAKPLGINRMNLSLWARYPRKYPELFVESRL